MDAGTYSLQNRQIADPVTRDRGTVLITGASSGIGFATARLLAIEGYTVIATSRCMNRLIPLRKQSEHHGLSIKMVELDINSDLAIKESLPPLIREVGGIDVLVNNAGYGLWGPLESVSIDELRAQFETNVFATLRLMKAVLPGMVQKKMGTIVNISSVLGRLAMPFSGAYAASKFALEGMSEAMRTELWPLGVRVVLLEPGLFRTEFMNNQIVSENAESDALPYSSYVKQHRNRHQGYPRLAGDPVKVARLIRRVIRSPRPAFRYTVGRGAWLGITAKSLLPERLFQSLLSRVTMR